MKFKMFITLVCVCLSMNSRAENLGFKGMLVIPTCSVNSGQAIDIDWGDIEIQELEKRKPTHKIKKEINIECPYAIGQPKISLTGARGPTPDTLSTTKKNEGLNIMLRYGEEWNGAQVPNVNSEQIIYRGLNSISDSSKQLNLWAALVAYQELSLLSPGPFSASANLALRYE
ncbi:fimbrial protein [Escherichia coli]|nr:fimbrial protein [Escherichia coli]EKR2566154.1 fimbrial protein [Escherichia coli]HAN8778400.1 fimbrial protein [Escherichia coli]HBH5027523.1 fimbrial protein [Escherichia coli]